MEPNILIIVFVVTQMSPFNLIKLTSASTESVCICTEPGVEQLSSSEDTEEIHNPIEIYKNFTDTVFTTISELGENNTDTNVESYDEDSLSIASLIGVSYILGGASHLGWSISYPGFELVMQNNSTDNILENLDSIFHNQQLLKCSNLMFISKSLNVSFDNNTKSFETTLVNFDDDDMTVPIINDKIVGLLMTNSIQQSYIPEGLLISSSTVAILFNVVETKKLKWSTPWSSMGKRIFNKKEHVEMIQFQGKIQFIEDETEIQVFLLFEEQKCGLALRMSKDKDSNHQVANIEDINYSTSAIASVQIPLLNYTLRSEYNFNSENTNCDFEKHSNYLQFLDVLAHVHLGPEYFEFVAISGAQVNNVEQYREEIRRDKDNFQKHFQNSKEPTKSFKSDENSVDTDYIDVDDQSSSENQINPTKEINGTQDEEKEETNKIIQEIIFDRPFTWIFFDDQKVPVVAGVVTSLSSSLEDSPQAYQYLGMEVTRSFPYSQCFLH